MQLLKFFFISWETTELLRELCGVRYLAVGLPVHSSIRIRIQEARTSRPGEVLGGGVRVFMSGVPA